MVKREEHSMLEVCEFCQEHRLVADRVGRWIWVKFDIKPSAELRARLKDFGFRWSNRRGEWAHNCGCPSKRSRSGTHPRFKYGSVPVESEVS